MLNYKTKSQFVSVVKANKLVLKIPIFTWQRSKRLVDQSGEFHRTNLVNRPENLLERRTQKSCKQ